jgi:hypothetical protein
LNEAEERFKTPAVALSLRLVRRTAIKPFFRARIESAFPFLSYNPAPSSHFSSFQHFSFSAFLS